MKIFGYLVIHIILQEGWNHPFMMWECG